MRRGVGAEKIFRRTGNRGGAQCKAMFLALGDRQAIKMRADAAGEHGVAIDMQMMRRDRRADIGAGRVDEIHRIGGRDVFEHHFERRKIPDHVAQDLVNEHRFAVEDVDMRVGHFAMHQQRHADALHRLQHRIDIRNIGDAVR